MGTLDKDIALALIQAFGGMCDVLERLHDLQSTFRAIGAVAADGNISTCEKDFEKIAEALDFIEPNTDLFHDLMHKLEKAYPGTFPHCPKQIVRTKEEVEDQINKIKKYRENDTYFLGALDMYDWLVGITDIPPVEK